MSHSIRLPAPVSFQAIFGVRVIAIRSLLRVTESPAPGSLAPFVYAFSRYRPRYTPPTGRSRGAVSY